MKFLVVLLVLVVAIVGGNALALNRRDELMQLKLALRTQLDQLEEKEQKKTSEEADETPADVLASPSDVSNTCPVCYNDSVCCRKTEGFECCAKIYSVEYSVGSETAHETIEVDQKQNSATFYLDAGGIGVFDMETSIASVFIPEKKACYLVGGIKAQDSKTLSEYLNDGHTEENVDVPLYTPLETPTKDHSTLHKSLQEKCKDLPLFWTEKQSDSAKEVFTKRGWCFQGSACLGWRSFGGCVGYTSKGC